MTDQYDTGQKLIFPGKEQIKSVCFYSFNFQDALSHLRMFGPARHLGIEVIEGVENDQVYDERALLGDIIVLQHDFPRAIESYEKILTHARQNNIPVILDFDDLLFELPEDHPDRLKHIFTWTLLPTYQAMLEVDLVTVTTEPLRDFILDYNKNVMVLPNYLDDQIWQLKPPLRGNGLKEKIIIGYMGGLTHQPDLDLLIPVFKNLIHRFPGRLEFKFWGTQPHSDLSAYSFVHWNDQMIWNYQDFAAYFQTQSSDILISPLADNYFNNCKSSIKYLEYGSLGVPGVFSRVQPYTTVIKHGENGFLATTPDEWEDCLVRLIESPELRFSLASNAQIDIQSNWMLSQNSPLWLSAYHKAKEITHTKTPTETAHFKMIKNLSRQTVMWHRDTQYQIKRQKDKTIELEDQVARQEATLSGITNSKTWKLALAFRHIREALAPPNSQREKMLDNIFKFSSSKHSTGRK